MFKCLVMFLLAIAMGGCASRSAEKAKGYEQAYSAIFHSISDGNEVSWHFTIRNSEPPKSIIDSLRDNNSHVQADNSDGPLVNIDRIDVKKNGCITVSYSSIYKKSSSGWIVDMEKSQGIWKIVDKRIVAVLCDG